MPYKDSYVQKIRQIVGHEFPLVLPSTDTIIKNKNDELLLVYSKDFSAWTFPGGYVEPEFSFPENAIQEVYEESGIIGDYHDLTLLGTVSGKNHFAHYKNGDYVKIYTTVYLLDKWQEETNYLDLSEISKKNWFSLHDIKRIKLTKTAIEALTLYLNTQNESLNSHKNIDI